MTPDETPADAGTGWDADRLRMTRRTAAKWIAAAAGAVAVGVFAVDTLAGINSFAGAGASGEEPLTYKNMYVKGTRLVDADGNPLTVSALPAGSGKTMTVFPEKQGGGAIVSAQTATLLVRFDETAYQSPTNLQGTVQGYAAYSKVCTHEGCPVSSRKGQNLYCPCHGSIFDPLAGAKVVSGPAPRALPQLPLMISSAGELLVAAGPFSGPIGPQ